MLGSNDSKEPDVKCSGTISAQNSIDSKGADDQFETNESIREADEPHIPQPASLSTRERHTLKDASTHVDNKDKGLDDLVSKLSLGGNSDGDQGDPDGDDDSSEDIGGCDKDGSGDNPKDKNGDDDLNHGVDEDNHNCNHANSDDHNNNQGDDNDDQHNDSQVNDADYNCNKDDNNHSLNQVDDDNHNRNQVDDDDHNQVDDDEDHNRNQVDDDEDHNRNQVDHEEDHNHNQVDDDEDHNRNQVDHEDHNRNQVDHEDHNHNQVDDEDHNRNQVDHEDHNHNQVDHDEDHNLNQVDVDHNHNQVDNDGDHNHNQVNDNRNHHNGDNYDDGHNLHDNHDHGDDDNNQNDHDEDDNAGNQNHHDGYHHEDNEGDLDHDDDKPYNRHLVKLLLYGMYLIGFTLTLLLLSIIICFLLLQNTGCYCQVSTPESGMLQNAGCHCQVSIFSFGSMHKDDYSATFELMYGLTNFRNSTNNSNNVPSTNHTALTNYSDGAPSTNYSNVMPSANYGDNVALTNYNGAGTLVPLTNVTKPLLKGDYQNNTNQTKDFANAETLNNVEALSSTYEYVQLQLNIISETRYFTSGHQYHPVIMKRSLLRHPQVSDTANDICQKHVNTSERKLNNGPLLLFCVQTIVLYDGWYIHTLQCTVLVKSLEHKSTIAVTVPCVSQAYQLVESQTYGMLGNISCQKIFSEVPFNYSTKELSTNDGDFNDTSLVLVDTVTAITRGTLAYSNMSQCSKRYGAPSSGKDVKAIGTKLKSKNVIKYWKLEGGCVTAIILLVNNEEWLNTSFRNMHMLYYTEFELMTSQIPSFAQLQYNVSITTDISSGLWENNSNVCLEDATITLSTCENVNTSIEMSQPFLNMSASLQVNPSPHTHSILYIKEKCIWVDAQQNVPVIYTRLVSLQNLVKIVSITEVNPQDYQTVIILICHYSKLPQSSPIMNYSESGSTMTSNIIISGFNSSWCYGKAENVMEIVLPIFNNCDPDIIFSLQVNITQRNTQDKLQVTLPQTFGVHNNDNWSKLEHAPTINILWCIHINDSAYYNLSRVNVSIVTIYCGKLRVCNNTWQSSIQLHSQFSGSLSKQKWSTVKQKTTCSEVAPFTWKKEQRELLTDYCVIRSEPEGYNSSAFNLSTQITVSLECQFLQSCFQCVTFLSTTATVTTVLPCRPMSHHLDCKVPHYQEQNCSVIVDFNGSSWTEMMTDDMHYQKDILDYKLGVCLILIVESYDVNWKNNSMLQSHHYSLQHSVITIPINNYNMSILDSVITNSTAILQCWLCTSLRLQPQDQFLQNISLLVFQYDDRFGMFLDNCIFNKSLSSCVELAIDHIVWCERFHNCKLNFTFVVFSYDSHTNKIREITRRFSIMEMLPDNSATTMCSQYCLVVTKSKEKRNTQESFQSQPTISSSLALACWNSLDEDSMFCMTYNTTIMISCKATLDCYIWTSSKLQWQTIIYPIYCDNLSMCNSTWQSSIQLHNYQFSGSLSKHKCNTVKQKTTCSEVTPFTGQEKRRELLLFLTNYYVISSEPEGSTFNLSTQIMVNLECHFLKSCFQRVTFLNTTATVLPCYAMSHHLDCKVPCYQEQNCSIIVDFNGSSWTETTIEDYWKDILYYKLNDSSGVCLIIIIESYNVNWKNNSVLQSHHNPPQQSVTTRPINNNNTSILDSVITSSIAILQHWLCTSLRPQPQDQFSQNISLLVFHYDDRLGMFLDNCIFNKSLDHIIWCGCFHNCRLVLSYDSQTNNFSISQSICEIKEITRHFSNTEMLPDNSATICNQYCLVVTESKEKRNAQESFQSQLMISYSLALVCWNSLDEDLMLCMTSNSTVMIICKATLDCYPWTSSKLQWKTIVYPIYCGGNLCTCNNTRQSSLQLYNDQFSGSLSKHKCSTVKLTTCSEVTPFTGQKKQRELLFLTNYCVISSEPEGYNSSAFNLSTQIMVSLECHNLQSYFQRVIFLNTAVTVLPCRPMSHHLDCIVLYYQEQSYSVIVDFNGSSWTEMMTDHMHYCKDILYYKLNDSSGVCLILIIESYNVSWTHSMLQSHQHCHQDPPQHLVTTRPINNYNMSLDSVTTNSIAILQCWLCTSLRLQLQDKLSQNISLLVFQYDDRLGRFLNNCRFNHLLPSDVLDHSIWYKCFYSWKFIFVDYSYDSISDSALKLTCSKAALQTRQFLSDEVSGCVIPVEMYTDNISELSLQCRKNFVAFPKRITIFVMIQKIIHFNISLKWQDALVDYVTSPAQIFTFSYTHFTDSTVISAACKEAFQSCILLLSPKSIILCTLLKDHVRIPSSNISARTLCYHCYSNGLYFDNVRECVHDRDNCCSIQDNFWCVIFENSFWPAIILQQLDCRLTYYQHHIVSKEYKIKINFNGNSQTEPTIDTLLQCCITILSNGHNLAKHFILLIFHYHDSPRMWILNEFNCVNTASYFDEMFNSKLIDNQDKTLLGDYVHVEGMYSEVRIHITANNLLQTWAKLQFICLLIIVLGRQLSFHTSHLKEFFRVRSQCICRDPYRICVILTYTIIEDRLIAEMHSNINIFDLHSILINYAFHCMTDIFNQNYSKFEVFSEQSSILYHKHYFIVRNKSRWLMDSSFVPPLDMYRHHILYTPIKMTLYHQVTIDGNINGSLDSLHAMVCKNFCLQEFSILLSGQGRSYTILNDNTSDNNRTKVARDQEGCNYWCLLQSFCSLSMGVIHLWEDEDFGFQHSLCMKMLLHVEVIKQCRLSTRSQPVYHHPSEENNVVERGIRLRVLEFAYENSPSSSNSPALSVHPTHYAVNVVSINKLSVPYCIISCCYLQLSVQEVNTEEDGASFVSLPTNCYYLISPVPFVALYGPGGSYNDEVSN